MKNRFKPIGSTLEKVLKKYEMQDIFNLQLLKDRWPEIDKTISIHSEPFAYDMTQKKLTIKVKNESWKKEFVVNKELLKSKIRILFKNIDINDIKII